jgi:AcrR family transcriptional regulator
MASGSSRESDGRSARSAWPLLDRERFETELRRARAAGAQGREGAARLAMERAALEVSGEVGFEAMTVEAVIDRSGAHRDRFYRTYASKSECYLRAYTAGIDDLAEFILGACASAPSWPAGMRSALEALGEFLEAEPLLARGLITEPWGAGGGVLEKRYEVFERLSRAIDRARRETPKSRHAPPPVTAEFILRGGEAAVRRNLRESGISWQEAASATLYLSVLFYFGAEAARAEVARLGRG